MSGNDVKTVEIPIHGRDEVIEFLYTDLPTVDDAKNILIVEKARLSLWHTMAVSNPLFPLLSMILTPFPVQ